MKHKVFLNKKAFQISKKYGIEYQEIKSQLYEIFCEALDEFDGRCKFFTFLFSKIKTVEEKVRYQKYDSKRIAFIPIYEEVNDNGKYFDTFCQRLEMIDSMATELSEDAQVILKWIFKNQYMVEKKSHKIPTYNDAKKIFKKWISKRFEQAWTEIKSWWLGYSY